MNELSIYLSKLIPLFLYPLNLALIILTLVFLFSMGRLGTIRSLFFLVGLLVLITASSGYFSNYLLRKLENDYPPVAAADAPEADVIILLGGSLGLPISPRKDIDLINPFDRIRFASQLYKAGKAKYILVSGGNVFNRDIELEGEGFYVKRLLVEWGVPEKAILVDAESRNTYQNARFSSQITQRNGFGKALLVTSATHMRRASAVFQRTGIKLVPMATDHHAVRDQWPLSLRLLPSLSALADSTHCLKEFLGIYYYQMRGWI